MTDERASQIDSNRILLVGRGGTDVLPLVPWDLIAPRPSSPRTRWVTCVRPAGDPAPDGPGADILLRTVPIPDPRAGWVQYEQLKRDTIALEPTLHVSQPWCPIACPCGEVHAPRARAFLTIVVGRPDPRLDRSLDDVPSARTLAVVPASVAAAPGTRCLRAALRQDFGPWAQRVVRALTAPFLTDGLVGFDVDEIDALTTMSSAWCATTFDADARTLARRLRARVARGRGLRAVWVAFETGTAPLLAMLNAAVLEVADCCPSAHRVVYSATISAVLPAEVIIATVFTPEDGAG